MSDTHFDEANEFLSSTGVQSAKFPDPGTTVKGRIKQRPTVEQQRDFDSGELLFWDDGQPRKQVKVILATDERDPEIPDDDGTRAVYVKANLQKAIQAALRKANAKLEAGGFLSVTYVQDGENKRKKGNPPKIYSAEYTPPSEADAAAVVNDQPQQPTAPAAAPQPAQPAAQPAQGPDLSGMSQEQIAALLQAAQQKS